MNLKLDYRMRHSIHISVIPFYRMRPKLKMDEEADNPVTETGPARRRRRFHGSSPK